MEPRRACEHNDNSHAKFTLFSFFLPLSLSLCSSPPFLTSLLPYHSPGTDPPQIPSCSTHGLAVNSEETPRKVVGIGGFSLTGLAVNIPLILTITHPVKKLYFKCTPLLSEVQLLNGRQEVEKPADMVALFASLPLLQLCVVDIQLLEYLVAGDANLPIRLPTPLHQLKALYIIIPDLGSLKNARAFLCLIMSSPNLYEVIIELDPKQLNQPVSNNVVASIGSLLEAENRHGFGFCLQHLTMFKIVGSLGMQVELDLLRFILATAPILRMIYIAPAANLDSRKASKFMKKVRKYKPVSEKAKVISLPIRN